MHSRLKHGLARPDDRGPWKDAEIRGWPAMKAWEVRRGELRLPMSNRLALAPKMCCPGTYAVSAAATCQVLCPSDFTLPEPWRPGHESSVSVATDTLGR